NSLVSEKTGREVTGMVKFSVTEYYKISDMLLSNLSTTSNGQLLETGGMVHITATSNNEELKLNNGQSIEINFPTKQKENDMQLFSGSWENENNINWIPQTIVESEIFSIVEVMPEFVGGEKALFNYISDNLQYPPNARESGLEGMVY